MRDEIEFLSSLIPHPSSLLRGRFAPLNYIPNHKLWAPSAVSLLSLLLARFSFFCFFFILFRWDFGSLRFRRGCICGFSLILLGCGCARCRRIPLFVRRLLR